MNCGKVSRKLFAYIEGDLTPVEKDVVEEHLKACGSCQRKLADFKLIIAAARQIEPLSPGPHFVNRLLCAINQKKRPIELLTSWKYRLTLSGMAFVIAACFTFFVFGPPISDLATPMAKTKTSLSVSGQLDAQESHKGFPVSKEILERDMALTSKIKADSVVNDSTVLPKYYVQPVGIKRKVKDNTVF